jgi:hypothetical protein
MKTNWDKLQAALDGLKKSSPEGFTAREFAEAVGASYGVGQRKLSELVGKGRAKFVGNRPITRMDGRPGVNPVYSLCNGVKK